jgi:hypothetical protein
VCGVVCGLRNLIPATSARAARNTSQRLGMHGDRSRVVKPPKDLVGPTASWVCVSEWDRCGASAMAELLRFIVSGVWSSLSTGASSPASLAGGSLS